MADKEDKQYLYKTSYVAKRVLDTNVDPLLKRQFSPNSSASLRTYEDLGLKHFNSKADMRKEFSNVKGKKLDKYWSEYKHRDELIARGQYLSLKASIAEENYIKRLEVVSGTSKRYSRELKNIINNLKRLPDNKKVELYGKLADGKLPSITMIYELEGAVSSADTLLDIESPLSKAAEKEAKRVLGETESKFKKAFEVIGEEYFANMVADEETGEVFEYKEVKRRLKESTNIWAREFGKVMTKSNFTNIVGADSATLKEQVINVYKDRSERLIKKGRALIYVTKSGREYIPFVKREVSDKIIASLKEEY